MMKHFISIFLVVFATVAVKAQTHVVTFHPLELVNKAVGFKYEFITKSDKFGWGVFYSHYNDSRSKHYTGHKICPFVRLYGDKHKDNNRAFFLQFKLMAGSFNSLVEYRGPDGAGGPNSINVNSDFYAVGLGIAGGIQIFSNHHLCIDFSGGTQFFPQLVDKEIVRNNVTYKFGSGGYWITTKNNNLPWMFFGPGSIIEFRIGVGFYRSEK